MKIIKNTLPISDIYNMMETGELSVNRSYQRGTGLWPDNARSYFIDTVLNEFPFPKVVIRQTVDLKTKKSKREIIDGQQRLTTIRDFINNKFKLTSVSKNFHGMKYEDLPEGVPDIFLAYEISIDNIVTATTEEILEIFRRINSYTLPLNTSEKRHATYQGKFKWFISNLTEHVTPFFEKYQTLSLREISRMSDADLLTECCQIKLEGIQSRNSKKLDDIYKNNDLLFDDEAELKDVVTNSFNYIKDNFTDVFDNCNIQSYNFYALMGALIFNKYQFPDIKNDLTEFVHLNNFCVNPFTSSTELIRIFSEAEEKNENGEFPEFVKASIATTHSYKNRLTRIKTLISALRLP
ncbi:DUF262 domain-containing protein [Chryseobacterium sp. G0201]|uniref:DUF262 domain-containing protein n=1 Tax=Chryseobacterium sp. G0201 TaxID=2487065 RepID=UPI000F50DFE8|nr:DUF262 domain-containing protein [Chryseobacterium sp. G0201]AZA54614.1 DUF262 domain-containing protein [Chryseobacterium sp. G0201]